MLKKSKSNRKIPSCVINFKNSLNILYINKINIDSKNTKEKKKNKKIIIDKNNVILLRFYINIQGESINLSPELIYKLFIV